MANEQEKSEQRARRKAIASLVTGIIGLFGIFSFFLLCRTSIPFFVYLFAFSPVFMLLSVKFGMESKKQASQSGVLGRGMTRAGLLLGTIGLILIVIFSILWAIIWSSTS